MAKALSIREVQRALTRAGFDTKGVDGAWGPNSRNALLAFQKDRGLHPDALLGPESYKALNLVLFPTMANVAKAKDKPEPVDDVALAVWYLEAARLKGLRETSGKANNSTIMGWARRLKIGYANDETPWCGLFVAHCLATALPNEPMPINPLGARNWLKYGVALPEPALGAILVFWRGSKAGWSGHVGFYAGQSADGKILRVLGGNQSDAVTVTNLSRDRLLGVRWPSTAPRPTGGPVVTANSGQLSTNEA